MTRTNVFDFLDPVDFLKEYFAYRKSLSAAFSYEKWADELNLGSRSLLRLILLRKRNITDSVIDLFCSRIFERDDEKDYFCDLVVLSQTRSAEERRLAGRRVTARLRRKSISLLSFSEDSDVAVEPMALRLYTVLDDERVTRTLQGLCEFFRKTEPEIRAGLDALAKQGVLRETNGVFEIEPSSFDVADRFGSKSLERFHEVSLKEAVAARDLPFNLRRYKSAIAMLSSDDLERIVDLATNLVEQTIERGRARGPEARRLYQMNFNIHALSEEVRIENEDGRTEIEF